jgi:predicted negative regulator of RcsB-dependent stress response
VDIKAAALNLKGLVFLDQNSKSEAKAAFTESLALAPDFKQAKENIGKAN